jgi:methyl-accepting chemotaxis protein
MNLKQKLTAGFLVVVVIPLVAMLLINNSMMKSSIYGSYEEKVKADIEKIIKYNLQEKLQTASNYIKFLAMDSNVVQSTYYATAVGSVDDLKGLVNKVREELDLSFLEVLDLKGKIVHSTAEERNGKNISQSKVIMKAQNGVQVVKFEFDEDARGFQIHTAARIKKNEKAIGIVHGGYILDENLLKTLAGDVDISIYNSNANIFTTTGEIDIKKAFITDIFTKVSSACRENGDSDTCSNLQFNIAKKKINRIPYLLVATPIRLTSEFPVGTLVLSKEAGQMASDLSSSRNTIIILTIIFSLAAVGIGIFITRGIVNPVKKLVDLSEALAEGDLTKRLDDSSKDELGELAKWFNTFVAKLHTVISKVFEVTDQVASSSAQLAATAEQSASGTEKQTGQITQIATSMEEMSATAIEVAKCTMDASGLSKNAMETASRGGTIVSQAVEGMVRIEKSVKDSTSVIETLGKSSEQIGQIISVIDEIADQTNLLALNAAIEAARAGDQGRGFAVVADEVKKLAERTTKATKEITSMIQTIQTDTHSAVSSMEDGKKEVSEGVKLINQAGEALQEIVEMVKTMTEKVGEIATAAEEQSTSSEEISQNTESVTQVAKELASGADQSATAVKELSHLSEELRNMVGQFNVNGNTK